ncbi:primosomal protein N' [Streptococcus sp. sy004]|uniref:primosomal protein N' n=1 Tax=Streptococcus sp. sy004 TaxID=2600149 RepID=UPI0011B5D66A|nr:primosomal protein N' [Streptococcus sp. sy004]TWT10359.1 primosomal protein N' [Streptococcus sp. sy004]
MKVAQVIVDIPLMQTDRPYSYLIPDELLSNIELGSRVHVPFGRGNRLLQGFVVDITENQSSQDLKAIVAVLDFWPVLTSEQLYLANQLRHSVFSYKISILKAMLPNLLNSNYDRLLQPTDQLLPEDRQAIFGDKTEIPWSKVNPVLQTKVNQLVKQGQIITSYQAKDRKTLKIERYYRVKLDHLLDLEISKRAKKRLELRDYLTTHSDGLLKSLYHDFSRDQVGYFIDKGVLEISEKEVSRSQFYFEQVESSSPLQLNVEQQKAFERIVAKIGQTVQTPVLLQGITGSGKTEVYLQVIAEILKASKTAIVLVPEISLTPQMTSRFISRFGQQVAILHSALSDGEKFDEWRKIKTGQAKVVVGARSAIFAPLDNIGAIIIDEEHDASYKQESNPRYHARDVALLRAKYHQAVLVLGSATPSLESRARASRDVYDLVYLKERANPKSSLPAVQIVDFRDYLGQQKMANVTPLLLDKIKERLAKNEQVVLLLNRRGYSSFVMCRECGQVENCSNCDLSLTLHMDTRSLKCHYCGWQKGIPKTCRHCGSSHIRYYGSGTQKAYDELQQLLPTAKILRMDVDTTKKKGDHQRILQAFGEHKADILLGTQMIAKGLDFANVTLVGVLNADTAIHLPDFRAAERTFQLLTQVAGRAGRAEKKGEVLIQTYNPKNFAIQFAKNQDYEGFYAYEMQNRKQLGYPPYYYTVVLNISHKTEEVAIEKSYEVLSYLKNVLSDQVRFLGPTPKAVARTHNLYHYQILIKYRFESKLEEALNHILALTQLPENRELRLVIDSEPQQLL